MRSVSLQRKTAETDIKLTLDIDGSGKSSIDTGCGFFDHMLTLFAHHGNFDLEVKCVGDVKVDYHHTVEDIGIVLGNAFKQCLGDKKGITRYGNIYLPMDEALVLAAVDISGRGYLGYGLEVFTQKVGDFDCELVEEFLIAFARTAEITLHVRSLAGKNTHHIFEAAFKGIARALRQACAIDASAADKVPSSKGVL